MLAPLNEFLNILKFNNLNQTILPQLDYNSLKSSIPKEWKILFLQNYNHLHIQSTEPNIKIGNINKSSKEMYNNFIINKIKAPTAIDS